MTKFSVCVASVRPTTLPATIRSIRAQTQSDWELIVVGQGTDRRLPDVVAAAAAEDRRIRYLHLEQRGLARARNAALRIASGEIIAMTDDDCEARADWLDSLARYFDRDPLTGLIGGSIVKPRATRFPGVCLSWIPPEAMSDPADNDPQGCCWFGANVAFRRSVVDRVGDFDPYLGAGAVFPSADDVDYRLRVHAHAIRMRSTPTAVVYHTDGFRYGWKAVWRYLKDTARGDGALGAKLTMLGDPRGRFWPWTSRRDWLMGRLRSGKAYRLPFDLLALAHIRRAYRTCLREYRLDPAGQVLQRSVSARAADAEPPSQPARPAQDLAKLL